MKQRFLIKTISVMVTIMFAAVLVTDLEARGRGGRGGGGFARSGPAAGGGFSARAAQSGARTASRQVGATQRSGQRTQARTDTRLSGQGERTERQGQRQEGRTERTETRQEERTERTEHRTDAARDIADDWDGCCHHYDNEWGYALAGAAVGAAVGYAAGTAAATPTYVTVLPCTPNVVVAYGTSYYQCGSAWYNRAYAGDNITYVTVNPPPGY